MAGYPDRRAAGRVLGDQVALVVPEGEPTIVLGLPRGGVPVAAEVARRLGVPLDTFGVRKLGAPGQPEFALGAIATGGIRVVNEAVVSRLGLARGEFDALVAREAAELARREHAYRDGRPPPAIAGKTVVLVDDGLATGATMVAAVRAAWVPGPARLIAATPVASLEGAAAVRAEVDEFVCPLYPPDFMAVGQFYDDFAATSDDEVRDLVGAVRPGSRR